MLGHHGMLTLDHERFKSLLASAVALRRSAPAQAEAKWREFSRSLRVHAQAEEEVLFPAYEANVHPASPGPLDELRAHHRELLFLLDGIERGDWAGGERAAREEALMSLLWTHEAREQALFTPWLRACLSEAQREALKARMIERCGGG